MSVNESQRISWIAILLSLATWWMTLTFDFVWDDFPTLVTNGSVHHWSTLWKGFTLDYWGHHAIPEISGYWRPLPTAVYVLLVKGFGVVPWVFHALNLLLHLGVVVLGVRLLSSLNLRGTALLVATIFFALHPLHSETVSFVSALPDLLAAFWGLLALRLIRRPIWSLLALGLALLSKESGLVFVVLWLIWVHRVDRAAVSKTTRMWGSVLVGVLVSVYMGAHLLVTDGIAARSLWGGRLDTHLGTVLMLIPYVMWRSLIPLGTGPIQPFPVSEGWGDIRVWLALLSLCVVLLWVWRSLKENRTWPLKGVGLFLLFWAPSANLIPSEGLLADRYLYLPILGTAVLVGVCVQAFLTRVKNPKWALSFFVFGALLWGAWAVWAAFPWRNERSLWVSAVETAPESSVAWNHLGSVYLNNEEWNPAREAFQKALSWNPDLSDAEFNLIVLGSREGKVQKALNRCRAYVDRHPGDPKGWDLLGTLAATTRTWTLALEAGEMATTLSPENWKYAFNFGLSLLEAERFESAAVQLRRARNLNPSEPRVWLKLGAAYFLAGAWDSAAKVYEEVLARWPHQSLAKDRLDRIWKIQAL